jgi:hypothetical protein
MLPTSVSNYVRPVTNIKRNGLGQSIRVWG